MKKLYLLRHGQTLFNLKEMVQGQCDSRLTELGEKQSEAAGEYFRKNNIHFDRVITSDLPRTEDTLEQFYTGDHERYKGLRERSYGVYEGDSNMALINILHNARDQFENLGIETDESIIERMEKTLKEVLNQEGSDSVLAVSHGDAMRTFADYVAPEKMKNFGYMPNCAIFEYSYDENNGNFILDQIIDEHVENLQHSSIWIKPGSEEQE